MQLPLPPRPLSVLRLTLVGLVGLVGAAALAGCGAATRPDGGNGLLAAGTAAPDLTAVDQTGKTQRIAAEKGHPLVVYFYPKDGTPGCTREACAFRDTWERYQKAGVQVFGVSADDQKSHETFAKEQHLPFPIVADPGHAWSAAFGVPTKLGMDSRVSFLIDAGGKIAKVYPNVDPGVHADAVLKDAVGAAGDSAGNTAAPAGAADNGRNVGGKVSAPSP
jgi:peroxiredoxin Q/BCP